MLKGKILKFGHVCNSFCKALVEVTGVDGSLMQVWSPVPKVGGQPIYIKGADVAWVPGPLRMFKGHGVRGDIAAIEDLVTDPEDIEASETWGLT